MPSPARTTDQANSNRDQRHYANLTEIAEDQDLSAGEAAWMVLHRYAKERPEVVALWAFGLGFVLGWKLKLW